MLAVTPPCQGFAKASPFTRAPEQVSAAQHESAKQEYQGYLWLGLFKIYCFSSGDSLFSSYLSIF
ncbi:hypothetical protein Lepto7375DRAFT_0705 [Leptolyngbya sp. PCC 7375]|nr:hypothetical protein Lepto7375DRAFT_0705 [Leptolyngbya sp. PCC 7375]